MKTLRSRRRKERGLAVDTHQLKPARDRDALAGIERATPALPGRRRRRGLRRAVLAAVAFCFSVLFLAAIAGGLFLLRLSTGPIPLNLGPEITAALEARTGGQYVFALGSTAVEQGDHGPQLTIDRFAVDTRAGRHVLAAPRATVAVDLGELVFGRIAPKRIEVQDVTLRVVRLEDGTIGIATAAGTSGDVALGDLAATFTPPAPGQVAGTAAPATSPGKDGAPVSGPRLPALVAGLVDGFVNAMFDPQGPLHALDRVGLGHGTLIIDDRLRHAATTYRNLSIDVDREATGGIFATVGAEGPAGRWSLASRAHRKPDGTKAVALAADHLTTDELMLVGGLRNSFFETDMPLSFSLDVEVGPGGRLLRAGGPVTLGAGYFKLDDPDHEPVLMDRTEATLAMAPESGAISLKAGSLVAGPTSYKFDLNVTPPQLAGQPWTVDGRSTGLFGPERPGESTLRFDNIDLRVIADLAARRVTVEHFAVNGPEVAFGMSAVLQMTDPGFTLTSDMKLGRMPGQAVLRLWPSWIAAAPRNWLLANVKAGTFDYGQGHVSLTDTDLDLLKRQHSVPDDHVNIAFGFSNATLNFMAGVPPLRGLDATGRITGDTFTLDAPKAEMEVSPGHKLSASEGSFTIASTDPKPTPAEIKLRVSGGIDAVADLLSRDALKPYADLPIDANAVSGGVDGRLTVDLKLGDHVPQEDTRIKVDATARNFTAAKVLGKESLTDATVQITADRASLHAKGEGRIFGAPAQIEIRKVAGAATSDAQVNLLLDDAARQKAGLSLGKAVVGPVPVKIVTALNPEGNSRAQIEIDLTRASLDAALPGLRKGAGKPARITLQALQENNRTQLDNIAFENGSAAIRGSAVLDAGGAFQSASLSQVRLSPGDDARAEITRQGDALRMVVRGTNLDARPFLKNAMASDAGPSGSEGSLARDIDLELHANLLTGNNAQALDSVDLRLSRTKGTLRKVTMTGRLGHGPFSVTSNGAGPGTTVTVASKDAGATLSFLDLYKRMDGGRLDSTLRVLDGRIDGIVTIHQFTIKEDPTIKKLADEEIPTNSRNAGARIDPSAVSFTKLEASFTKVGNRVDVRQGSMFGPNVGATVEGTIDFGKDKVVLAGTFVPIYGLNNLFSQIPVVGMLLGGGSHEGLFALNYRIGGSTSAPVLTFNPLSALAPGFLRKIFGAIDDAAQQGLAGDAAGQGASPDPTPSQLQ